MKLSSFQLTLSVLLASAVVTAKVQDDEASRPAAAFDLQQDRELQVSVDDPNDYFNFYSDADDWARCNIANVSDGCLPTVSIEEAACRAELIVWGRIIDENSNGDRKIGVNWRSYIFDEPKLTVAKWGAGLDNSREANTTFSQDSGQFHTWVSGFSTDGCGTRPPLDGDSAYFFLEGLPENEGVEITFDSLRDLNVNFRLVTTAFGSGIAYGEDWKYIQKYRFGTQGCDRVACCYKPDCASCSEFDVSDCEHTTYVEPSGTASIGFSSSVVLLALGVMFWSLIIV
ncbi:unnamed protein product [Cylindrotheca closterium]|uniref:DOMON domain-containing protein n=1 Tax=Cylindrotheca closterium TaxID=2856 RepID=A0AAD2GA09_9STRA|nr:unnamed protein product [Cylindrotheca closterium]CAJ1965503.1 unnamed protein product [Cylindrotheca closterium]